MRNRSAFNLTASLYFRSEYFFLKMMQPWSVAGARLTEILEVYGLLLLALLNCHADVCGRLHH